MGRSRSSVHVKGSSSYGGSRGVSPNPPPRRDRPDTSETYNGWTNWDTWNTMLIMQNEQPLENNLQAWNRNWRRKAAKGQFDMEKAKYAVKQYIIPQARKQDSKYSGGQPSEIDPKKVNTEEIAEAIFYLNE